MIHQSRPQITFGTGLSGAGGGLLLSLFFAPWLRACGMTLSGKDLAFGINVGYGVTTQATYPWLALVPLAGLAVVVIAFLNLNQSRDTVRSRTIFAIGAGGLVFCLLIFVGIGFIKAANDPAAAMMDYGIEFGYGGSLFAAVMIIVGGFLDLDSKPRGAAYAHVSVVALYGGSIPPPQPLPGMGVGGQQGMASLTIQSGELAGHRLAIPIAGIMIGRSPQCDLQLSHLTVSRQHARIRYAQGAWFLQDQQSSAGTLVNGRRVMATRLNDGDVITIGHYRIVFHAHALPYRR